MTTSTLELNTLQENVSEFMKVVLLQDHDVILSQIGKPIARVTPMIVEEVKVKARRMPGQLEGKIIIHGDFNEPLPEGLFTGSVGIVNGKRIGGVDKGKFVVPDDFNDPLPTHEEELWYQ